MSVVKWIEGSDEDSIYISVLTLGEIQKGISKLSDERRRVRIQQWLDTDLRNRFEDRILEITEDVALTWGEIEGTAEAEGRPIPVIDCLIGATAIAHNLTVVTRNIRDIEVTGARVLNVWTF